MKTLIWPLPGHHVAVPKGDQHPGAFAAVRKHDIHTGIDLYAPVGQPVIAMEDGVIVAIDRAFTGGADTPRDANGNPIWLPTAAVLVEGERGVILYGELEPVPGLAVGTSVTRGARLGSILPVLPPKSREYRNPANSPSMLHLELYEPGIRTAAWWKLGEPRPLGLLDPTPLVEECRPPLVLTRASARSFHLSRAAYDFELLRLLSDQHIFTDVGEAVRTLTGRQGHEEQGTLLTDGSANIFFGPDSVCRVYGFTFQQDWIVNVRELRTKEEYPEECPEDDPEYRRKSRRCFDHGVRDRLFVPA